MRKIKLKETQKLSTDEMKSVKGGAGGGHYCDTSQICFGYLDSSLIQGICHFTGGIGNPVGMCYCMKEISSGYIETKDSSASQQANKDEEKREDEGKDEEDVTTDVQTILTEGDQNANTNAYE